MLQKREEARPVEGRASKDGLTRWHADQTFKVQFIRYLLNGQVGPVTLLSGAEQRLNA